jgi:AcrR family transcriptional regulator
MLGTTQRGEMQSSIKKSWILDKAGELFWQQGYDGTSMREIADACGCKPANIYNYFTGKEDILYEVIRDLTEQMVTSLQGLEDDEDGDPIEQLKLFVKTHFELLAGRKRSNVLISDAGLKDLTIEHREDVVRLRDQYDTIMRRVIRRGINKGHFSVKDERIVGYLISSVIMRSNVWFSPQGRLSADEVGDIMFDFVLNGIKTC